MSRFSREKSGGGSNFRQKLVNPWFRRNVLRNELLFYGVQLYFFLFNTHLHHPTTPDLLQTLREVSTYQQLT